MPPLDLETEAENKASEEANARRSERLARKDQGKSWVQLLAS